jgi:DNA topoisomerase VI subunit B
LKTKARLQVATLRSKTFNNKDNNNGVSNLSLSKYGRPRIRYDKKAESEFFVDNSALAGFIGERILYMAVRELIENALDSCETHGILPNVTLSLTSLDQTNDLWHILCEDNGVGIPSDKVPVAVCSFLTSGKYVEKQQRGLFGVGLKMIAAFSTKDTDHPLRVWSKSRDEGSEYYFELRTDIGTNKPVVLTKRSQRGEDCQIRGESGFKIEAVLRARLSPITKNKIYDYVSQTSIVNPYAFMVFRTDEGQVTFDRRTEVMPEPAREVLPHPSDMDLKTLKKAIASVTNPKTTLHGVLCNSFQKLSGGKAKEIISKSDLVLKSADKYDEHELIKVVNVCKQTKFQSPNTEHLSPIGEEILTTGMTSEYAIVTNRNENEAQTQPQLAIKVLQPALTAYSARTCVVSNRPTIVECGIAYGGDITSFELYRFANKIPLLYDEGSDVAREVVSEVEINKMGISKKEVKEQFARGENKSDRAVEFLPIHIFFHICSTKIPYKTAGKESIASENELKRYMKSCLAELYRKVSAQIRKELRMKEAESKLRLYKHYIPLIISAISESIRVDTRKLSEAFSQLAEKHVKGEILGLAISEKHDKITGKRIDSEADRSSKTTNAALQVRVSDSVREPEAKKRTKNNEDRGRKPRSLGIRNSQKKNQTTLDVFYRGTKRRKSK